MLIKNNNSGETLIEMIISIAIFALMIGMISLSYSVSQDIILGNFTARNEMNTKIIYINEATLDNATQKNLEVSPDDTRITWRVDGGAEQSFYVKVIRDKDGTIGKYVNVP